VCKRDRGLSLVIPEKIGSQEGEKEKITNC
jgi:hypothetical protein